MIPPILHPLRQRLRQPTHPTVCPPASMHALTAAIPRTYDIARLLTVSQAGSSPNVSMVYVKPPPDTGYS